MSEFTTKFRAFLHDIVDDAKGAEGAVVAWAHSLLNHVEAGHALSHPVQAGAASHDPAATPGAPPIPPVDPTTANTDTTQQAAA